MSDRGQIVLLLAAASLLTAVLLLVVFRWTSNQQALRRARSRVLAQVLAIRLFADDPWTTIRCLGRALGANLAYLRHTLVPLLVSLLPVVWVVIQLDLRFGRRPLRPGEAVTAAAVAAPGGFDVVADATLEAADGLEVETDGVRIELLGEVDWRVGAGTAGVHELRFVVGEHSLTKKVVVGEGLEKVSPVRAAGGWWNALIHPGEPALPADSGVRALTVDYPRRELRFFGWRVHWVAVYFILSIAFAFLLRRPLGVEI